MEHTLLAVGGPADGQIITGHGNYTRVWDKPESFDIIRMHGETPPTVKEEAETFQYQRVWLTDTEDNYTAFWVPVDKSFLWAVNQLAMALKRSTINRELAVQCHSLIWTSLRNCAGPIQEHKEAMEKLRAVAEGRIED